MTERKSAVRFLAVLITLSLFGGSPQAAAEAGWTEPAHILSLEANIFGRTLVELDLKKNPSGCKAGALFFRETTGDSSANMLQVLLEAAANRLPVKLRVTGICHLKGYAEFSAVAIVP
jgi:hypothetical protein